MTANGVTIRKAAGDDLREVEEIWADLMRMHAEIQDYYEVRDDGPRIWGLHAARCLRRDDARLFVADKSGEIVGFLLAHLSHLPYFYRLSRIGMVSDIAVKSGHRGTGIGRLLVEAATAWFEEMGMDRAAANMVPANPQALAFWKAMGFAVLSEYRVKEL